MNLRSILERLTPDAEGTLLRRLIPDLCLDHQQAANADLTAHLRNTSEILRAWQQPVFIQLAGLCHTLYAEHQKTRELLGPTERDRARKFVSPQAEELAYLFCSVRRPSLFRAVSAQKWSDQYGSIAVEGLENMGPAIHHISLRSAAHLVILHMAKMAETGGSANGAPIPWLTRFADLAKFVVSCSPETVPEVFATTHSINSVAELRGIDLYLQAAAYGVKPELAIPRMEECSRYLPAVAEPELWLSYLWGRTGDEMMRAKLGKIGLRKMQLWGCSWDKRLSRSAWIDIAKGGKTSQTKLQALFLK